MKIHEKAIKSFNHALVMGKFMPIHLGHVALVKRALSVAKCITIAVVAKDNEPISMEIRKQWFEALFCEEIAASRVLVTCFYHSLPHDGSYEPNHVLAWCQEIASRFTNVDAFVSSEAYGDVLADYMGIEHLIFDLSRETFGISGTAIRENPRAYREFLPEIVAKYYGL